MGKMKGIRPYEGEKAYLFASYAHSDQEVVEEICEALYRLRYRLWFDEGIQPGRDWGDVLAEKISKSTCFLAFISAAYLKSDHCLDELYYAIENGIEFVMIYLEDVKLPGGISMRARRKQAIIGYNLKNSSEAVAKIVQIEGVGKCRLENSSTISGNNVTFFELESGEMAVPAVFCREWLEHQMDTLLVIWGRDSKYLLKFKYAIKNWLSENKREFQAYYAEEWICEWITALRKQEDDQFKEKMMQPEILILDNIDFFAGKTGTQEEFCYILRKRNDLGKTTILLGFGNFDHDPNPTVYFRELEGKLKSLLNTGTVVYVG